MFDSEEAAAVSHMSPSATCVPALIAPCLPRDTHLARAKVQDGQLQQPGARWAGLPGQHLQYPKVLPAQQQGLVVPVRVVVEPQELDEVMPDVEVCDWSGGCWGDCCW